MKITVSGTAGSGKSTISRFLKNVLIDYGFDIEFQDLPEDGYREDKMIDKLQGIKNAMNQNKQKIIIKTKMTRN